MKDKSKAGLGLSLFINSLNPLLRWIFLASVIGVVAGLGAVLFYDTLTLATQIFLKDFAGYQVPLPKGEGNLQGSQHFAHPFLIPISTTLGGLLAGLLVFSFAPEAEGHGTDAAISAFHRSPWGIRLRVVLIKIVASALTIGSGGSGGREGPTGQISAGFGSLVARSFRLSPKDSQIAVAVGVGSGIGAIFGAPLGGAILAGEILYSRDIEARAIVPGLLASTVAYAIFGSFLGYTPLFGFVSTPTSVSAKYLWIFAAAGVLYGIVGVIYSKVFYGFVNIFHRVKLPRFIRPALGGALVGLIALFVPEVLGTGYGWIQLTFTNALSATPLVVILAIPFLRIVATSLSIGSGGSGGIFGPGMVIGAFSGYSLWRVLEHVLPAPLSHDPSLFVIGAMAATFGSVSRAPIAVTVMVFEMTGNFSTVEATSLSVVLASIAVALFRTNIYEKQLPDRSHSIASRLYTLMQTPIRLVDLEARGLKKPSSDFREESRGHSKDTREVALPLDSDLREAVLAKSMLGSHFVRLGKGLDSRDVGDEEVLTYWFYRHRDSLAELAQNREISKTSAYNHTASPFEIPLAIGKPTSNTLEPPTVSVDPGDTLYYFKMDAPDSIDR